MGVCIHEGRSPTPLGSAYGLNHGYRLYRASFKGRTAPLCPKPYGHTLCKRYAHALRLPTYDVAR
ncbi:MAG: hypothetical protein KME57_06915 [Scytonema hyalinum WJT4-NPBG1]|nr:hypothetical protein [Scytonema hyalinum WJT4-NPBG1]